MKRSPEALPVPGSKIVDAYKLATHVVVNIDGEWKGAVLVNDARINADGKLEATVSYEKTPGITEQRTIAFEEGDAPEIIAETELTQHGITDAALGGLYNISNPTISPEGYVEYTVKAPTNEVYTHVPQELLLSWKKTLELEEKVRTELERKIHTVREDKRAEFQTRRLELEKSLAEVYTHLPEVGNMQDVDTTSIKKIQTAIQALHVRAEREIEVFEKEIAAIDPEVPEEQESLEDFTFFEKESAADKKLREERERKAHAEDQALASQLLQEIRDIHNSVESKIEKERLKYLEDLIDVKVDKKRDEYNDAKATYDAQKATYDAAKAAYDAQKPQYDSDMQQYEHDTAEFNVLLKEWERNREKHRQAPRFPDPGQKPNRPQKPEALREPTIPRKPDILNAPFDEHAAEEEVRDAVKIDRAKSKLLTEQKEKALIAEKKAIIDALSDPVATPDQKRIWAEVERRRLAFAQRATKNLDGSGTDLDKTGDDSPWLRKNIEILEQVLTEYGGEYEFKEHTLPDERTEKIFDWEQRRDALLAEVDRVERKIGDTPPTDPTLRAIYDDVKQMRQDVEASYAMLENLEKADALLGTGPKTIQALNGLRLDNLQLDTEKINGLSYRFDLYKGTKKEEERTKAEQKEISEHQKAVDDAAEKHEFTREGIDIPDNELREMLLSKAGGVRSAMELMMRGGGVKQKPGGTFEISQDLMNQIRGMFTDQPPHLDNAKLRSFGIKSWDKFKTLWDTELAEKAAVILNTMVVQTLERRIAEQTSAWDKAKAHKWSILGRGATNAAMIGVGALGAGELVAMLSDSEDAQTSLRNTGRLAGGAAAGLTKWGTFKAFFGRESAKQKMAAREEKLHEQKREELIASVLGDMFASDGAGGFNPKRFDTQSGSFIDGNQFDGFTRLLSHTIRETSAGEESFTLNGHTFTLSGSDLMAYQRHLKSIETRNPDENMKVRLAWAIAKMKSRGAELSQPGEDPSMWDNPTLTDKFMANMQGQETKTGAVLTNVAIAGLMMTNPYARGAFGAAIMGRLAAGFGEQMFYKGERKEAVQRVEQRMAQLHTDIEDMRSLKFHAMHPDRQKEIRARVIDLKRVLHGTASPEDMAAVIYKVKRKGKKEDGTPLNPQVHMDSMKFADIQALVYEAERENIYLEEETHKAKLDHVLAAMQKTGDEVATQQEEDNTWKRRLKKGAYKYGIGALGAVGGVAIGLMAPTVVRGVADAVDYYADAFGITDADGAVYSGPARFGISPEDVNLNMKAAGLAGLAESGGTQKEMPEHFRSGDAGEAHHNTPPVAEPAPDAEPTLRGVGDTPREAAPEIVIEESPDIVKESMGTEGIKKGEGPLHAMNRLANANELDMTAKEFRAWKMDELRRMGIVVKDGKWGWPFTVHEGAKVELYMSTDGEPHVRLIGEEGKTITSHDTYRFHSEERTAAAKLADENNIKQPENEAEYSKTRSELAEQVQTERAKIDALTAAKGKLGGSADNILSYEQAVAARSGYELGEHVPEGSKFFSTPEEAAANTVDAKMAATQGDGTEGITDADARGAEANAPEEDSAQRPVAESEKLNPGVQTLENAALADTYQESLNKAVLELNQTSEGSIVRNSVSGELSRSVSAKVNGEFDMIARGEVPAQIQDQLYDSDVVKNYILEHLSPEEKLLFVHGEEATFEGAAYVDMAEAPTTSVICLEMPGGGKHMLLPPEGYIFVRTADGELALMSDADNIVGAELHTNENGTPYIAVAEDGT